jgi:hypothetical protein
MGGRKFSSAWFGVAVALFLLQDFAALALMLARWCLTYPKLAGVADLRTSSRHFRHPSDRRPAALPISQHHLHPWVRQQRIPQLL